MQIIRTTNPNGTYRYTLDGEVIMKGSKRRSTWATIYRLTHAFGTNNAGDITATLHARSDLAGKGSRDLTRAGWAIIAVVEVIDADATTEEEKVPTTDAQATTNEPEVAETPRPWMTKTEAAHTIAVAIYGRRKKWHRTSPAWHMRPDATEIATVIASAPEGSRVVEAGAIRPADRTIRAQYNIVKRHF